MPASDSDSDVLESQKKRKKRTRVQTKYIVHRTSYIVHRTIVQLSTYNGKGKGALDEQIETSFRIGEEMVEN